MAKFDLGNVKVPNTQKPTTNEPIVKVGKLEISKDQVDKVTTKTKAGWDRVKNAARAAKNELSGPPKKEEETKEPFIKIGRFKIG